MAALIFFFSRDLRKCFLEGREVKHWIIAKSTWSARRLQDFSVNAIRDDRHRSSAFRQCNRANETRGTLGSFFTSHLAQEFFNSLRIRRLRSGVSRGMNPGRTAESRHGQPRVIREDQPAPVPRVMQRLACRVFGQRWSVFFERGKRIEIRQQRKFNWKRKCWRIRERAILGKLPWIG